MIIKLLERHYADAPTSKSAEKRRGLAIDAAWKELYSDLPVLKFAPLDGMWRVGHDPLGFGIFTHEVKSFAAKSITISQAEKDFADNRLKSGNDHLYWIYEQVSDDEATFLGVVEWSRIHDLLKVSKYSGYYIMIHNLKPLLKEISHANPT